MSINIIVPVLIKLDDSRDNVLDNIWIDVANHFQTKLAEYLAKPQVLSLTWSQMLT